MTETFGDVLKIATRMIKTLLRDDEAVMIANADIEHVFWEFIVTNGEQTVLAVNALSNDPQDSFLLVNDGDQEKCAVLPLGRRRTAVHDLGARFAEQRSYTVGTV